LGGNGAFLVSGGSWHPRRHPQNPRAGWSFTVSPILVVWLFPFGWSTWVSLRVVGEHRLTDLADLLAHVTRGRAIQWSSQPPPIFLNELLDRIAEGVRSDAFAGDDTADSAAKNLTIVTSVLAKHGGSPSVGALTARDEQLMWRLIHPHGPSSSGLADHVFRCDPNDELEFGLRDDRTCFLWLEHRLRPEERNRDKLRHFHQNTFRSLVQAAHLQALVQAIDAAPTPSSRYSVLRLVAVAELRTLPQRYASPILASYLAPAG
jgi:hypothetical protein